MACLSIDTFDIHRNPIHVACRHLNGMRLSRIDHLKGLPRLETL